MYTGYVTAGGSICIEALTLSGSRGSWQPDFCFESIINVSTAGIKCKGLSSPGWGCMKAAGALSQPCINQAGTSLNDWISSEFSFISPY